MIHPTGTAIRFESKFTKNGYGVAALTVTCDVRRNGTVVQTAQAATDDGDGWYSYTMPFGDNTGKGNYSADFKCSGDVDHPELPGSSFVGPIEEVWDVTLANHLNVGSTGEGLQNAVSGGGGQQSLIKQTSGNVVAGTPSSGTVADTEEEDGVTWDIDHSGTIDVQITFTATNLYISELLVTAALVSHRNDFINIQAWNTTLNAGAGGWETISTEATRINPNLPLSLRRIGLNANHDDSGTVIIRFTGSLRNSSTLSIDYAAIIASTEGGYVLTASEIAETTAAKMVQATYGGRVYLDTENGNDPAEVILGETGTARFPLATVGAAINLANALGKAGIRVSRNSSITLAASLTDQVLYNERSSLGSGWDLAFNGQDIPDCVIQGASISGIFLDSSDATSFDTCTINTITGPSFIGKDCVLAGKLTSTGLLGVVLLNSASSVAEGTAEIQVDNAAAPIYLLDYNGYVKLSGLQAGNVVQISGSGKITIGASCTGGTIKVAGNFLIEDEAGAAVTVIDEPNLDRGTWIPEQTADIGALTSTDPRLDNLDATISSRATQVSVDSIPTNPLLTDDARLDNLDAAISSRATQVSVDNLPTAVETAKEILISGLADYEDDARAMSLMWLLSAMFKSTIDENTDEIILKKSDGTELARISATFGDGQPILSVG